MADRNKFEEMLERLVNEDRAGAEELFHEIVVEKSRDIYESLLESDLEDDEEVDETTDEEVDESDDEEVDESEDDAELDEDFNLDEFEVEADPMADMMGGDKADDMMGDMEMGSDDDSDDGEEGTDERINDLEDALEELKAEFEKMMSGDDSEEADDEMDMGDEEGDEEADDEMDMGDEEPEEESFQATITPLESKSPKTAGETMREYVEKVTAKMGDNGASTTSTVAKPNNMGGTSANIAKGATADTKGTAGGLASNKPQAMNTKNVNVVGAKGATKMSAQPGHGAEKSGKPETAANTKSTISK
jgi:hypothetical protein